MVNRLEKFNAGEDPEDKLKKAAEEKIDLLREQIDDLEIAISVSQREQRIGSDVITEYFVKLGSILDTFVRLKQALGEKSTSKETLKELNREIKEITDRIESLLDATKESRTEVEKHEAELLRVRSTIDNINQQIFPEDPGKN